MLFKTLTARAYGFTVELSISAVELTLAHVIYVKTFTSKMCISDFICQTTSDCNNKGTCTNGKCQCTSGWDSKADCASEYKNIKTQGLC